MCPGCGGAIQGKESCSSLHLSAVAIEKGEFGLPSTTVTNVFLLLFCKTKTYITLSVKIFPNTQICPHEN